MLKHKIILSLALLCSVAQGFANDFWSKTRYSVTAGVNATFFHQGQGNTTPVLRPMVGVHAEHYFKQVDRGLFLTTGLQYSPMAHKYNHADNWLYMFTGYVHTKEEITAHYLVLPLQVGYQLRLGRSGGFLPAVGLYAGYGLGGHIEEYTKKGDGETTFLRAKTFDYVNRFDMGVNVSVGFQFAQRFRLGLDTKIGLINRFKANSYTKFYTKRLGLTATYIF